MGRSGRVPMIMIPEGEAGASGYRKRDILVVGDDGAEDVTGFPFGPEHLAPSTPSSGNGDLSRHPPLRAVGNAF